MLYYWIFFFFFSSRRRHTRLTCDWSSDVCSSDLPRTLTRRFQAAAGMPPGEWIQRERLRLAQRLLQTTEHPIDRVARHAGYGSVAAMRAQFAQRLHTSPRSYRETFRARAGATEVER